MTEIGMSKLMILIVSVFVDFSKSSYIKQSLRKPDGKILIKKK